MDVKSNPSEIRNRAVGMLLVGITQKKVAKDVGVSIRTIKRWWLKHSKGEALNIDQVLDVRKSFREHLKLR